MQGLENMPELTERHLAGVLSQMLTGIAHCHSLKVVHHDIKPDNFLFSGDSRHKDAVVKLADFGMAKCMPKQGKLSGVRGTAPYMCPEMLMGGGHDEKADVWSFAVTAYVLLFGEFPYMALQESVQAVKDHIVKGSPRPSFEAVKVASSGPNARMRSISAVWFVKALLVRQPEYRPSAMKSLRSPWMTTTQNHTVSNGDLPSLRPVLQYAKELGLFGCRDLEEETGVDSCLSAMVKATISGPSTRSQDVSAEGLSPASESAENQEDSSSEGLTPKTVQSKTSLGDLSTDCDSLSSYSDIDWDLSDSFNTATASLNVKSFRPCATQQKLGASS
jgi:serine/threonine protein kinase